VELTNFFNLEYRGRKLLCKVFITSKSRRTCLKVFYGCCYFYLPDKYFLHLVGIKPDLFEKENPIHNEMLEKYLLSFLIEISAIEKFERRGIFLQGQLNIDDSSCFILGEKKEITSDFFNREGKMFVSHNRSVYDSYDELAFYHFQKRIDFWSEKMGILKKPSLGLSRAVNYLGLNSLRHNRILLNSALYAYRSEVSDAVVIHELAHCLVRNHSKTFYDIVIKYCPEYYRFEKIIISGMFGSK